LISNDKTRTTSGTAPARHRRVLRWLIPVAVVALLFGSCIRKWPHYEVTVPGGYVTETRMFMRGTWGEQAHLPIRNDAELAVRTICYPPEPDGYQHCHLIIELRTKRPMQISFNEGAFVARQPSNHETRFDSGPSRTIRADCSAEQFAEDTWCVAVTAPVLLDYEQPPRQFELLIPSITIEGEELTVPPIRFEYDDSFAYQFVPWITNF